jgi:hypothetical protein
MSPCSRLSADGCVPRVNPINKKCEAQNLIFIRITEIQIKYTSC